MNMLPHKIKKLLQLEFRLILRNKRVLVMFGLGIFMILFLLIANRDLSFNQTTNFLAPIPFVFFSYLLIFFSSSFGQFTMNWESSYANLLFTLHFKDNEFLRSKYYMLLFISILTFLLITVILLFINQLNLLNVAYLIAALLYNNGISMYVVLFFSRYNTKYADLNNNQMKNYQLSNIQQFISILIVYTTMYFIYFSSYYMLDSHYATLSILMVVGTTGILFHKIILKKIYHGILQSKYDLLDAYNDAYE